MKQIIILVILSLSIGSCSSIVSLSQADLVVSKGEKISINEVKYSFLYLTSPKFELNAQFAKKCPGGLVSGVQTSLYKRDLVLFQEYEVLANGSCQMAKESPSAAQ